MIVCSCNAIRESDIRKAARAGAPCPKAAYGHLGFKPKCGGCLDHAAEIVVDERMKMLGAVPKVAA